MNPLAIRIAADLKEFRANMAEMKAQLETNASAMKRMASAFDGSRVIGDANAMVKAIDSIGGASKLTEAEMKRVNATVNEALTKYKALGREAPAELLALRDATKQVAAPVDSLSSKLKGLAGTLGVAFGAAAVVTGIKSLISGAFEYAEQISDLSARMAVSTDAAQRWKFAAEQSGSSIETVGKAVTKLSTELDGGSKSFRSSLDAAGLSFDNIRKMAPEQAFDATVKAVSGIADPMTQARVATELFGKAGAELLPAIRNGFDEAGRAATVMSEQTIKDLDRAKDEFEKLGNTITVWAGTAISKIGQAGEAVGGFVYRMSILATEGRDALNRFDAAAGDLQRTQERLNAELEKSKKAAAEAAEGARKKAEADAEQERKAKAAAAAQQRLAEAFQKQVDVLTGKALASEVAALNREVAAAEKQGGLTAYQYRELGKRLDEMRDKGATLPTKLHNIWLEHERLNPSIKTTIDLYKSLGDILKTTKSFKLELPPAPLISTLPGPGSDPFGIIKQIELSLIYAGKNPNIKLAAAPAVKTWMDGFRSFMSQASSDLANSIVAAIQGGGDIVLAGFASLAQSAGRHFGAKFAAEAAAATKAGVKGISAEMAGILGAATSGIIGLTMSIITDMFTKAPKIEEILAGRVNRSVKETTDLLKQMGEAGSKAFNDMTHASGSFFDKLRQRRTGLDDATAMFGLLDQFQTKEELEKVAAQWKGVYDYMLSSGKFTAQSLADAWKQYEDAQKRAIGAVEPEDKRPVGARGFPTKAQLQQAVKEAEEAYKYVRDSGEYTAEYVEQAWNQWQDALIKSGDETAKRMKDLTAEITSLQKAVEAETPEYDENGVRMYGVEEQRNIERLAALEAEKSALQIANIEKEQQAVAEAAKKADLEADKQFEAAKIRALDLDGYLRRLFSQGYEIPITYRLPNGASYGSLPGSSPSSFGGGGTPLPSGGGMAQITILNVNQMDGEVVARKTVTYTAKLLPRELAFMGVGR